MAHGSEEGEDYWPGYVDALTSMVQVLAFVMMLLAMAVFVLSQSITKSAVEEIAKAAKVDAPKEISIQELVAKIVKEIKRSDAATTSATAPRQASAASAAPAASASAVEMEKSLPQSVGPAQAERAAIPGARQEKPAEPSRDAKRFVVRFGNGGYALDTEEAANIEKFVGAQQVVEKNARLFVRAYAYSGGGLTEARRIAYYRAIMVRAELIRKKASAENIQINVFDTGDREQGSTVEVFVDGKAPG